MKADLGRFLSGMIVLIVLSSRFTAGTGGRKERPSRIPEVGRPMPRGSSIAGLVHGGRKYCSHRVEVKNVTTEGARLELIDGRCGGILLSGWIGRTFSEADLEIGATACTVNPFHTSTPAISRKSRLLTTCLPSRETFRGTLGLAGH